MDDPVNRLIVEREGLDAGFPGSVVLSVIVHLLTIGVAVAAPLMLPKAPVLIVADGFAVPLPRGGGGSSAPAAPAAPVAVPSAKPSAEPEPVAPPPPKVVKPPKEEQRTGLPDIDQKRSRTRPATPPPTRGAPTAATGRASTSPGSAVGGTGTSSRTPGIEFGPPSGVGVPDGTDSGGDWYMASVQQKIWLLWTQQLKAGFTQPVGVTFTIQADGSVNFAEVEVTLSSGSTLLDMAAKRAVLTAAPFGPLPKDYGTTRKTVQALFKPTP